MLEEARGDGGRQRPGDQPSCTFPARKRDSKVKASERPWDKEEVREKLRKRRQETECPLFLYPDQPQDPPGPSFQPWSHHFPPEWGWRPHLPRAAVRCPGGGGIALMWDWAATPSTPGGAGQWVPTQPPDQTVTLSQLPSRAVPRGEMVATAPPLPPGACPIRKAATQAPEAHSAPSL